MRKKHIRRSILAFYCLLLLPTVVWGILSIFGADVKLDYDTGENRNKHTIETDTTVGTITNELELSFNDRIPFRSVMLSMNRAINWVVELPYSKGIQPALISIANSSIARQHNDPAGSAIEADNNLEGSRSEEQRSPAETSAAEADASNSAEGTIQNSSEQTDASDMPEEYFPYIEVTPNVIQGRDGWLFMKDDLPDYQGASMPGEEKFAEITQKMQVINDVCQNRGQTLCYLILPNKSTVYSKYMPTIDKAERSAVSVFEDYVHTHTNLCFEYIDQEIIDGKQYGQLYYFNDSHWNGRGALTAVAALHRILGLEEIDLSGVVAEEGGPKRGDLIDYSGLQAENFVQENTLDCYYKTDVEMNYIQGQTDTLDELVSTAEDGRTLVLIGDSFRHGMMPYLSKDFAHVYYFNNDILSAEHADILESADIIVVEDVERTIFSHERFQNTLAKLIDILS